MELSTKIVWGGSPGEGTISVRGGSLAGISIKSGKGTVSKADFKFEADGNGSLQIDISDANISLGSDPTVVSVKCALGGFSYLLRDVNSQNPVFLPMFSAAVLPVDDVRMYDQVKQGIEARGLRSALQKMEDEPEESFENAAANVRKMVCPTWLGISRDMRNFEMGWNEYAITVSPKFHSTVVPRFDGGAPETVFEIIMGKGIGPEENYSRTLEDGELPIVNAQLRDNTILFNTRAFVTLEKSKLKARNVKGTNFLAADGCGYGHMFTEEEQAKFDSIIESEKNREEETVYYLHTEAVNTGRTPAYAWFKAPFFPWAKLGFDTENGLVMADKKRAAATFYVNGEPAQKPEIAALLQPGEVIAFDVRIPHQPISIPRAKKLASRSYIEKLEECKEYWGSKSMSHGRAFVPEQRVSEMMAAGMHHLDLVTYGNEPDGTVAACIGVYCPIGSESAPIIQYIDSMGWHDLAERAIQYFIDKQRESGFIQNFGNYMLETGPALWTMGEHFRYTHDLEWVKRIKPNILKACEYLQGWCDRNKDESLRGRGYGLMDGKVADPEDPFHSFMLNAYAYLGLSRVVEMLEEIDLEAAKHIALQAQELKDNILDSLREAVLRSPVVPLSDGTWCPTVPPFAESSEMKALLVDKEDWFTHGTFAARDGIGPIYLALGEVLDSWDPVVTWILDYSIDMFHQRNVFQSQPYYCPHSYIHLKRGEVKPFLKEYYNGFAALADRDTYTFWEHFYKVSPHKTHEEGWFLMQSRWMLWMEEGDTLKLFPGIPRDWMQCCGTIYLEEVASYFGKFTAQAVYEEHDPSGDELHIVVVCDEERAPKNLSIRVPHRNGRKASYVSMGVYDPQTETVLIENFPGGVELIVKY